MERNSEEQLPCRSSLRARAERLVNLPASWSLQMVVSLALALKLTLSYLEEKTISRQHRKDTNIMLQSSKEGLGTRRE